jgi:hypothetical protein
VKREKGSLISKIRTFRITSREYSTNKILLLLRKKRTTRK